MTSGNIKFQTMPTVNIDYWPYGHGSNEPNAIQVDPAQVAAFVHGTAGIPTTTNPAAATVTVDVTNAAGIQNLASTVGSLLLTKGFARGTTGDTTHRATSAVYYPAGQQANAQAVATALGGRFTLAKGPSVPSGHVWVYLGGDYQAPSTAVTTTSAAPPPTGTQPISDAGNGPPCVN